MAKPFETYSMVEVESYVPAKTGGLHGKVHIRPCPGQGYPADMHAECARKLRTDYPIGARFRLKVKLTDREGSSDFLYSNFNWNFEVLG